MDGYEAKAQHRRDLRALDAAAYSLQQRLDDVLRSVPSVMPRTDEVRQGWLDLRALCAETKEALRLLLDAAAPQVRLQQPQSQPPGSGRPDLQALADKYAK
jgi:hypothetical protein